MKGYVMKKLLFICSMMVATLFASEYERANSAAKDAFRDLDCEFEDCKKEPPKPKVIIKERVIVKEKPVVVEKVVVKEKVVYKDAPKEQSVQQKKKPKQESGVIVLVNRAFFDLFPTSQAPILDYIKYSQDSSFDIKQFTDSVSKIRESNLKVHIYGRLEIPKAITTQKVYVYSGENYFADRCCWGSKRTYFNSSKEPQASDYLPVEVLEDKDKKRYITFKIVIDIQKPWKIRSNETDLSVSGYRFKVAPYTRGYKDKFVFVTPYIIEE